MFISSFFKVFGAAWLGLVLIAACGALMISPAIGPHTHHDASTGGALSGWQELTREAVLQAVTCNSTALTTAYTYIIPATEWIAGSVFRIDAYFLVSNQTGSAQTSPTFSLAYNGTVGTSFGTVSINNALVPQMHIVHDFHTNISESASTVMGRMGYNGTILQDQIFTNGGLTGACPLAASCTITARFQMPAASAAYCTGGDGFVISKLY